MAPQGAEQKDGRDQSTPFGLRKWWVRKSEHTWVRFRERRGTSGAQDYAVTCEKPGAANNTRACAFVGNLYAL
jgi:hypothetical protein